MNQKWYVMAMLVGVSLLALGATASAVNPFDYTWTNIEITEAGLPPQQSPAPIDPWFAQYDYSWNLLNIEAHHTLLGGGWIGLMDYVPEDKKSGGDTLYGIPPQDVVEEHYEVEETIDILFWTITVSTQADVHAWIDADGYGWVEVTNVSIYDSLDAVDKARFSLNLHVEASHLLGDANLDDNVNSTDYTNWANGYSTGSTWAEGDFNLDDEVNSTDYTIWANHYGWTDAGAPTRGVPTAVPEPATMSLLGVGILALLRRRK